MSRVFTERGSCKVWISITDDGSLRLSAQDIGGWMGTSEYEYFIGVRPDDFGTINAALGKPIDADVVESMCGDADAIFKCGEQTWLTDLGIEVEFSEHHSFD